MDQQEKKYRVESFDDIIKTLHRVGATNVRTKTSIHFYGIHGGSDIFKFVKEKNIIEARIWKETNGMFSLIESTSLQNETEGFQWLRHHGCVTVGTITMEQVDYKYQGGTVGLYIINDILYSVILTFPPEKHEQMEKTFELQSKEVISIPFNVYLEKLGLLTSFPIPL